MLVCVGGPICSFRSRLPLFWQLVRIRAGDTGNPYYCATWADETANRVIGIVGRAAHSQNWEARVLVTLLELEGRLEVARGDKRK